MVISLVLCYIYFIKQFEIWFKKAKKENVIEPNAMVLSTISKNNLQKFHKIFDHMYDIFIPGVSWEIMSPDLEDSGNNWRKIDNIPDQHFESLRELIEKLF